MPNEATPAAQPLARYGPIPRDASSFMRRCRLLQCWYRVEIARQAKCGPWQVGGDVVGSALVDGEVSGANFLSPAAFAYAKEKVAERTSNRWLTIDEHRLFNNMLSSHPMCFNLFADLRLGVRNEWPNATDVLTATFRESRIRYVTSVDVEHLPTPIEHYIEDKTAFDALIRFRDVDGKLGIAAVETKYTDKLGIKPASRWERQLKLADAWGVLNDAGRSHYAKGFDQIARNLLLAIAFSKVNGVEKVLSYTLGPREDVETPKRIEALRGRLNPPFRDILVWLPLDDAVERGLNAAGAYYTDHLRRFRMRYLDFTPVEPMLLRR